MKLFEISIRNLSRNKLRTVFAGIAIAVVTMGIVIYFSLEDGMMVDLKNNIYNYITGHFRIRHREFDENEQLNPLHLAIPGYREVLAQVEKNGNVEAAAPRIQFGTVIFGSPRISVMDIIDQAMLIKLLQDEKNRLAFNIKEKLKPDTLSLLKQGTNTISSADFITLLDDLNTVIQRYNLHDDDILKGIALSPETKEFLKNEILYRDRFEFNRLLLEDAFPEVIKKNSRAGKTYTGIGFGVDMMKEKPFFNLEKALREGALPQAVPGHAELALSKGLAEKMNLTVGDKLTITTKTKFAGLNGMTFRITGILNFSVGTLNSGLFFLPLKTAQEFLKMSSDDSVIEILVKVKNSWKLSGTIASVSDAFEKSGKGFLSVRSWETIGTYHSLVAYADIAVAVIAFLFFLAGTTVIIVTTIMVIFERMKEIGTIGAMGMTGGEIVRLFFLEAFFLSAIAAFSGTLAGIGITIPLSIYGLDFTAAMKDVDMDISGVIYPVLNPVKTIFVYFYSVAVASLSTLIPSRRAAKIEPVEALRAI